MKSHHVLVPILLPPLHSPHSHFWFLRCPENNSVSRKINRTLLLIAFNCIFSFPDVSLWQKWGKGNSGPSEKLFWHRGGTCVLPNSSLLFSVHPAVCLGPGRKSLTVKLLKKKIKTGHSKGRSSSRMNWSQQIGIFCLLWQLTAMNKSWYFLMTAVGFGLVMIGNY